MNEFFTMGALIPLWILIGGMAYVITLLLKSSSYEEDRDHAVTSARRDHATAPARPAATPASPAGAPARPAPAR